MPCPGETLRFARGHMLFLVKTEPDEIEIVAQDDIIKEVQLLPGMVWGKRHPGGVQREVPKACGGDKVQRG